LVHARGTGLLVGAGAATAVVATMVAATIPVAHSGWRFAVVAVAVGAFAALTRDRLAVACTGTLAWLLVNGFLVDRFGELSWHGRADAYRTLMIVVTAALGLVAGEMAQLWLARRRRRRLTVGWPALSDVDEEDGRDA
jgi:hypothetical protein